MRLIAEVDIVCPKRAWQFFTESWRQSHFPASDGYLERIVFRQKIRMAQRLFLYTHDAIGPTSHRGAQKCRYRQDATHTRYALAYVHREENSQPRPQADNAFGFF